MDVSRSLDGQMTVTAVRGHASKAFFLFDGEVVSVQVRVPSALLTRAGERADDAARLAAARALVNAAALLVGAT